MVQHEIALGLVIERLEPSSPWGGHIWMPVQVLEGVPDTRPWTELARGADRVRFYAGAFNVTLYSTETAFYRDNLMSGQPKLWIGMQPDGSEPPVEVMSVTADPTEGEGMTQTGTCVVEAIDMPDWIAAQVAAFVEANHVEREFIKRKRDKRPPDMMGRRGAPDRREG